MADEELAKKEAERARKRELDDDELGSRAPESKRQRSSSLDSVSSFSTRSSKSPPPRRARDVSPPRRQRRSRSIDSVSDVSQRRDHSPVSGHRPRRDRPGSRRGARDESLPRERPAPRARRYSVDSSDGGQPPQRNRRYDSRSPGRTGRKDARRPEGGAYREYRDRHDGRGQGKEESPARQGQRRAPPPQPEPPRERSLSPFSRRLALTQSMNTGR